MEVRIVFFNFGVMCGVTGSTKINGRLEGRERGLGGENAPLSSSPPLAGTGLLQVTSC